MTVGILLRSRADGDLVRIYGNLPQARRGLAEMPIPCPGNFAAYYLYPRPFIRYQAASKRHAVAVFAAERPGDGATATLGPAPRAATQREILLWTFGLHRPGRLAD